MRAALDTRDLLLARQAKMNQEIDAGMHKEEGGQRPAAFQKAYAQVLVDLQMVINSAIGHTARMRCVRCSGLVVKLLGNNVP